MLLSSGSQRLNDSLSFLGRQWTALKSWLLQVNFLADASFSCTGMALLAKGQTVGLNSISQVASWFLKERFGLESECQAMAVPQSFERRINWNKPLTSSQGIHPSDPHFMTEKYPEDEENLLHQGTPYHCWVTSPVLLGRKRGEEEEEQKYFWVVVIIILLRLPCEEELEFLEMRGDAEDHGERGELGHLEG